MQILRRATSRLSRAHRYVSPTRRQLIGLASQLHALREHMQAIEAAIAESARQHSVAAQVRHDQMVEFVAARTVELATAAHVRHHQLLNLMWPESIQVDPEDLRRELYRNLDGDVVASRSTTLNFANNTIES